MGHIRPTASAGLAKLPRTWPAHGTAWRRMRAGVGQRVQTQLGSAVAGGERDG
jgi:hypothetical protein